MGRSLLQLNNSQVHSNVATFSASISSWNNSLFIAINCSLRQNSGRMGDGISIYARTVYLESCSLVENQATLNGGASLLTGVNLKVSNSMFVMNTALLGSDLYIETGQLYTYKSQFQSSSSTLNSFDLHFKQRAFIERILYTKVHFITVK